MRTVRRIRLRTLGKTSLVATLDHPMELRPLNLVGHLKTTGRQEMLHLESGRRLFLLLPTNLVEESEMLWKRGLQLWIIRHPVSLRKQRKFKLEGSLPVQVPICQIQQ
uniref:Uncharacterized protein n=1 Tax=Arundo donax TaxID=35708 RepID=A0A0A9G895_ARUDO